MRRILLVDPDPVLAASLAEQLGHEGAYDIVTATSAAQARAAEGPFAAAVIAARLGDGDGDQLAAALKADGMSAPVLLLTEAGNAPPRAAPHAIQDSLEKPFRFAALLAKLQALSAQTVAGHGAPVRIGPYLFDPGAKSLKAGPKKIRLTEKEAAILSYLHASAGTVARERLLHEVWGYGPAVTTHTLETHIYRLRRKIEPQPGEAQILLTEDGGYRLSA